MGVVATEEHLNYGAFLERAAVVYVPSWEHRTCPETKTVATLAQLTEATHAIHRFRRVFR